MTTKSGARIYRGPSIDPLAKGACPHCFRVISVTANGRRRHHRDGDGLPCTGGGVTVGASDEYALGDLPDVALPPEPSEGWITVEGEKYVGNSDRDVIYGRTACQGCGRQLPLNSDGTIRRHRVRHQDPLAPYCEAAS